MHRRAYLFDLDMTLLNTSSLAPYRDQRDWDQVKSRFGQVEAFSASGQHPHLLPKALKEAGHLVGVVTSSPRWYAEQLLAQFSVPWDVLVAHGDTPTSKPDPGPVEAALAELGVAATDAVYLGDDVRDFESAYLAGVTSAGAMWGILEGGSFARVAGFAPDCMFWNPFDLARVVSFSPWRYIGDALCSGDDVKYHVGTVLYCDDRLTTAALGRYYKREDPRHVQSLFSQHLLRLKTEDTVVDFFVKALKMPLKWLYDDCDHIVAVPPKPGVSRDRFQGILNQLVERLSNPYKVVSDGLRCISDVTGYKNMNRPERRAAIGGAFECPYEWNEKKILLIDDVMTTGFTISECRRTLLRSGAGQVKTLAFGKSQFRWALP